MSVSLQQLTESDVTDAALSSSDVDQIYHQISEGSNVSEYQILVSLYHNYYDKDLPKFADPSCEGAILNFYMY